MSYSSSEVNRVKITEKCDEMALQGKLDTVIVSEEFELFKFELYRGSTMCCMLYARDSLDVFTDDGTTKCRNGIK